MTPKRSFSLRRWIALALVAAASAGAFGVYSGALQIPDRFNPWAPST